MGKYPALIVSGVIWGLWHAPLTVIGHNFGTDYPGFPYVGILKMCFICIVMGILLTFVTEASGSIWPAAILHAVNNTNPSILNGFVNYDKVPSGSGLSGESIALLITAVVVLVIWRKMESLAYTSKKKPCLLPIAEEQVLTDDHTKHSVNCVACFHIIRRFMIRALIGDSKFIKEIIGPDLPRQSALCIFGCCSRKISIFSLICISIIGFIISSIPSLPLFYVFVDHSSRKFLLNKMSPIRNPVTSPPA